MTALQQRARGMRVLMVMRSDASAKYGGDTRLAYETLAALRACGIDVDLVETESPNPRGYDLVHVVNVGEPKKCAQQMDACDAAGVPYVLSPVWLELTEFWGRGKSFERTLKWGRDRVRVGRALERLRTADNARLIRSQDRGEFARIRRLQSAQLRRARVLIPNSAIEARDCMIHLGVRDVPMIVAPIATGVEPADYWQDARTGVIAIGRVESRKNQLATLYALAHDAMPIEIVGEAIDLRIIQAGLRWCPRARFLGRLPREEVLRRLGRAAVHVMPSWCETAGIASLEAAIAGAQVVVGDRGAEYEYFGEDVEYADPADPASIRAATLRALARPPRVRGDALDRRIRAITWRQSAEATIRAYEIALGTAPATAAQQPMPANLTT